MQDIYHILQGYESTVFSCTLINPNSVILNYSDGCLNEILLKRGLAHIIDKNAPESMIRAQEEAKKQRLLIWCYGDFTSDD